MTNKRRLEMLEDCLDEIDHDAIQMQLEVEKLIHHIRQVLADHDEFDEKYVRLYILRLLEYSVRETVLSQEALKLLSHILNDGGNEDE